MDMNFWDWNSRLGYMQLMALSSWLIHEETRVEELKRAIEKKKRKPYTS